MPTSDSSTAYLLVAIWLLVCPQDVEAPNDTPSTSPFTPRDVLFADVYSALVESVVPEKSDWQIELP